MGNIKIAKYILLKKYFMQRKKYKKTTKKVLFQVQNDWNGTVDRQGRIVKDSLFAKKVVYLQRQKDKVYPYNQYVQLCSIQKKLKT